MQGENITFVKELFLLYFLYLKEIMYMDMGKRIEYLRKKEGWSQAELARRVRIGQSTLHGYESGARAASGMSVDVAVRLAQVLRVSVDYLAGRYGEPADECRTTSA